MLIQPSEIKENDVVTLKLVGGDEVVAKLISDAGMSINVTKPMLVMMAQQGFGLLPYVLTADPKTNYSIKKDHVIAMVKTLDQVSKEYIKQTTNLHLP